MGFTSVTYTFSNSTTADASQVNQNFQDIISGLSDGTKDISIAALTVAGNASFSGNLTFGNASSDTITFTGSQASHLNPSAHNSYDFGTVTTLGYRAFYFASSSATKTAKVQGPAISSDITLTLPATTGTIGLSDRCSFSANTSTTAATTSSPFIYTVEDHDTDSAYSTSTGVFTVPTGKGGVYHLGATMYTGATATFISIFKNGSIAAQGQHTVANTEVAQVVTTLTLAAGDTVDVRPGANATASGAAYINIFWGFRLTNNA